MVDRLRLSRSQIAKIVGNDPEAIKQFERLFQQADTQETGVDEVAIAAGLADGKANQALDLLQRISDALEVLALAPVPVVPSPIDDISPPPPANNSVVTDYIDLPENGPHVTRERRVQWNADDGTMDVGLYGGSVLQVGQELHYYAKNTSGATITNGSPVIVTGTLGASGKLTISPALGDGSVAQRYFIGAATQDIANNAFGYVTSFGLLRSFNTSAFLDGDLLYVSPTTPGAWTKTLPSAPNWKQPQAIVVHAAVNGSIFMRASPEHALSELQGVTLSSPASGQLLAYNGTVWVNTGVVTADLTNNTGRLVDSSVNLTNGAGANVGTLTNSPVTGDPTKWVPIDDNGTTRYIPAW